VPNTKAGFALITVLFSLAIITLLLTASSHNVMRNLQFLAAQKAIAEKPLVTRSVLQAYMVANDPRNGSASVGYGGESYRVEVQNVGGLIDANAASMELIEVLIGALELEASDRVLALIKSRRQSNDSFGSLREFASEIDVDVSDLTDLATVYSGRSGIDLGEVSRGFSEIIGTQVPERFHQRTNNVRNQVLISMRSRGQTQKLAVQLHLSDLKLRLLETW